MTGAEEFRKINDKINLSGKFVWRRSPSMKEHNAKHIITKKVITIGKDATAKELLELLIKNKISGVPVVDDNKQVIGMITQARIRSVISW